MYTYIIKTINHCQMSKIRKEGKCYYNTFIPHLSQLVKYWLFYGISKVRSIIHIEVIDNTEWLNNELIYQWRVSWITYLLMRWIFLCNPILLFFNLIDVLKWTGVYCHTYKFEIEDVSFFIKPQMKKSSCSFNMVSLKPLMVYIWYARCRNTGLVCKWSVTITC